MGLKHCKEFSSTDDYEREQYKSTEKGIAIRIQIILFIYFNK